MEAALRVSGLHKQYGRQAALQGLDMEIPKGSIAAFVGANGAGKTTTFSLIGGFFRPSKGRIEVCGRSLRHFRRDGGIIGLLPQDVQFYETRTVWRQALLFAQLCGLRGHDAEREVERVLGLVELTDRPTQIASELSHGMKVRLGVALALIGEPPLVLLDEPTAGLDPRMLALFRKTIESIRGRTTVVISSHDLSQLQVICDYVCIIDEGKLVKQAPMRELLAHTSRITLRFERPFSALDGIRAEFKDFSFSQPDQMSLNVEFAPGSFRVAEVNSRLLHWLFKHALEVTSVESQKSLEQTYLEETMKSKPPR